MSFLGLMNKTCLIKRKSTPTIDSMGGSVSTSSTILSNQPCRLQTITGRERAMRGTLASEATHKVFMPVPSTTITARDICVIDSVEYDIQFVETADGMSASHHIVLEVKKRT